jgi:hypothetical protein
MKVAHLLFGLGILLRRLPYVVITQNISGPLVQTLSLVPGWLEHVAFQTIAVISSVSRL